MLEIIQNNKYNEVVVTSFIRLLANCPDDKKWEILLDAAKNNPSAFSPCSGSYFFER
jgi:hypothetical protein